MIHKSVLIVFLLLYAGFWAFSFKPYFDYSSIDAIKRFGSGYLMVAIPTAIFLAGWWITNRRMGGFWNLIKDAPLSQLSECARLSYYTLVTGLFLSMTALIILVLAMEEIAFLSLSSP